MTPWSTPITHPESAWLAGSTLVWLTVAVLLGSTLLLRGALLAALAALLDRRSARGAAEHDPWLTWSPPIASPGQLLTISLGAGLLVVIALTVIAPVFVALALAAPAVTLVIWAALQLMEARYVARLDRELPAAAGRLGAALRSGGSFQRAVERVAHDLPAGPLRAEWLFLYERLAAPAGGRPRGAAELTEALARQTPSQRHAALLDHLAVALTQTHDVLVQRVEAASAALFAAERRRSATATELAQMRYSGVAIGLAGVAMFAYLAATQAGRMARAYAGPLGLPAGVAVALALAAPFIAGVLLARADDVEY